MTSVVRRCLERCLLEPTPQKNRAMVNEKENEIAAFGGAGQERVCQT